MIYKLLADLVLVSHLLFILFALFGAALTFVWRYTPLLHLPALAWGAYIEFSGQICPLTPLEVSLRQAAGEVGYGGGFIDHYIMPVIYPAGLTPNTQVVLGIILLAVNVLLYTAIVLQKCKPKPKYSSVQGGGACDTNT
jgi:hypothetical protein